MPSVRPPMHGRDHRPGGADPIPFVAVDAIWGRISRSGGAGDMSITSGALNATTTLVVHDSIDEESGVDCDIVSSPSRITIQEAGTYMIVSILVDGDSGSGDYGLAVGHGTSATGAVWSPTGVVQRVLTFGTRPLGWWVEDLDVGDYITQVVGQNSGSTKTDNYLASLTVIKVSGELSFGGGGGGGGASGSAGGVLEGTYPDPGLAASVAGSGLSESADVLAVNVDNSTLEINADALRVKDGGITEAKLSFSDVTTNDVSMSKHGFAPKAPNDPTKFLDGTGAYTKPFGSSPGGGGSQRLYDYTVSGSDKASIDTNVDGTTVADFSGYDVLEVWLIGRTDEAVRLSQITWTFNNDTGSNYDRAFVATSAASTTPIGDMAAGGAGFLLVIAGASQAANVAGIVRVTVPNYLGTTFYKNCEVNQGTVDTSAATTNRQASLQVLQYRSTSAVTRIKVTPNTAGKLFKVGTRLIVYGR